MRQAILATIVLVPAMAFAAGGGGGDKPPKTTKTTAECTDGTVWDDKAGACVAPEQSSLDDDGLYQAAREFAYAGQYQNTLGALAAMSDPSEDRVLTYLGFATRQLGDMDGGMAYYRAAIEQNPDNLLARSYMGQAFVKLGALDEAREQLTEIRVRGGRLTWAEVSLASAIGSGQGYNY